MNIVSEDNFSFGVEVDYINPIPRPSSDNSSFYISQDTSLNKTRPRKR